VGGRAGDDSHSPIRFEYWWVAGCVWTAAILYFSLRSAVAADVRIWLLPWYSHILEAGRWAAFAEPFGNYTPPYLYILAFFSNLSPWLPAIAALKIMAALQSVLLAATVLYLLRTLGAAHALPSAAAVLLLPPVVINGPVLSQCDPLWVAPCVLAVAEAIRGRISRMLVWCGLAISIKLQAAFLAPFALGVVLNRNAPLLRSVAIPVLVYVLMMVPAAIAGWPPGDLATIYIRQAMWANEFISNAASPWTLGNFDPVFAKQLFPVGYVAAAAASAAIVIWAFKFKLDAITTCQLALLSAIVVPFLLPRMHERYFLLADILAFSLACANRRYVPLALLVVASSTSALSGYLFRMPGLTIAGIVMMAAAALSLVCSIKLIAHRQLSANPSENLMVEGSASLIISHGAISDGD